MPFSRAAPQSARPRLVAGGRRMWSYRVADRAYQLLGRRMPGRARTQPRDRVRAGAQAV